MNNRNTKQQILEAYNALAYDAGTARKERTIALTWAITATVLLLAF